MVVGRAQKFVGVGNGRGRGLRSCVCGNHKSWLKKDARKQADRQAGRDSAYFILLFSVLIYFSYRFIISDVPLTHSF